MGGFRFERYLLFVVVLVLFSGCATMELDRQASLVLAAEAGHTETVKALLDQGADVNVKEYVRIRQAYGKTSFTPLIAAASQGHTETVKLLLARGADVDARGGEGGTTALIFAAMEGHADTVKLLLAQGANVNAKTVVGSGTALMLAAAKGHTETVKALLAHGADVSAKTDRGVTALIYATGKPEIIRLLKQAGAKE